MTSDREEEALQTGGVPSSFCRLTSDQGMPAPITSLYLCIINNSIMVEYGRRLIEHATGGLQPDGQ